MSLDQYRPSSKHTELYVPDNSALQQSVEVRFRKLIEIWQSDRPLSSRLSDLVMHPAYQQIIGLGPQAIPLLLREIEQNPDWWFSALHAITGAAPEIPPESKGKLKELSKIWLAWGHKYNYYS